MGKKPQQNRNRRVFGVAGGISGAGSIISAHNVCHSICLAVVAILSVFGIIVSSDILMWLQDYNLFFWSMGAFFLGISLILYYRMPCCISKKLILINAGLVLIGFPFFQGLNPIFWIPGSFISLFSCGWYLRDRYIRV